jgi:hypothetical protein
VTYLITPQQTLSIARQGGIGDNSLALSGTAVLTFSKIIVDHLTELCSLKDIEWISPRYHPYCAADVIKRGVYKEMDVIVLVPPMGASPLACILEDLIACGIQTVLLACAAWSLGPPVDFGDLIIPSFSVGLDGTSIHYGNIHGYISAESVVVDALTMACNKRGEKIHVGGNVTCEALYRISPKMVVGARQHGCLSMENGEVNTLFAVTQALDILGGVLFQPYIDLQEGWNPACLFDSYPVACRSQAEIVLDAGLQLSKIVDRSADIINS